MGCASRQFCQSLNLTNVYSGWTEPGSLLNNAHYWVKEQISAVHSNLPFLILVIDSDNGGEFINHQLFDWCVQNNIKFTRGRPYRKNDNCLWHSCRVEQKNGEVIRKTVGYVRFECQNACDALAEVYRYLSPLLNYWNPTLWPIAKEKLLSGRYKKIYEKEAKMPYQRLLESPDVGEESKAKLRCRAALLNPVQLKRAMDEVRDRLLKLSMIEAAIPSNKVS